MNHLRNRRQWLSRGAHVAAVCLTAVFLTHSGCDRFQPAGGNTDGLSAAEASTERVETVAVEIQDITDTVEMAGTVEGFETADLYAKVGGYVKDVLVDIGDNVEEGQILAVIDIPEMETQLIQKQALIRQAEAEVEQAFQSIRQADAAIGIAEASLLEATAEVRFRQTEYDRFVDLSERRSVQEDVVDAARFQLEEAQAGETTAKKMIASAEANLEKARADHKASQAHVDVAEADAAYVQAMLQYSEIRAPFTGRVTHRWMDSGAFIQSAEGNSGAQPILTVARTDTVRVSLPIPMNKVRLLDIGDRATLTRVNVLPGESFEGEVSRFSAALDMNSRMMHVEIDLPNEDQRLLPGYYGYVTIQLDVHAQTPVVPSSALLTDSDGAYVFAVRNGTAHQTRVTPIYQDGIIVGLETGDLVAGDEVVKAGGGQLIDGQLVDTGSET